MATRKSGSGQFKAIPGYKSLQPLLDSFSRDHPDFEKNVFIATRFRSGKQFSEIHQAVKTGLAKYGLIGLRADDKTYPTDGDLWANICVYLMGCKYGVCVFEEIDEREFNPNVPLEYGFLRAINRQVLLLKDQRMPKLPTDMTGKIYRHFDSYNITETIRQQIGEWIERDLGLKLVSRKPDMLRMIETLTANTVLILWQFSAERKSVFDAMRDALKTHGYNPIHVNFATLSNRNQFDTVSTLAHLSRFIVADFTDTKSIPQELMAIIPSLPSVPVQPLLLASQQEHGTFEQMRCYPWVLPTLVYKDQAQSADITC
jgi:hypothetical protein